MNTYAKGMRKSGILRKLPVWLFMIALSVCALLPFYMMIVMGTHYSEDLYTGVKLFFGKYFVQNFPSVLLEQYSGGGVQYGGRPDCQCAGRLCLCKV